MINRLNPNPHAHKTFIHGQPVDEVELFRKIGTGDLVEYLAVPFSTSAIKDNYLLIRTVSSDDLSFCRYYPVQKLLEGDHVPYYAAEALLRLQSNLTLVSRIKRRLRVLLGR